MNLMFHLIFLVFEKGYMTVTMSNIRGLNFQTPVSSMGAAVCCWRLCLISYSLDALAFILQRFSGDGVRVGSLLSGAVDVRDRVQRKERVIKS